MESVRTFLKRVKIWLSSYNKKLPKILLTTFIVITLPVAIYFVGKATFFKGYAQEQVTPQEVSAQSLTDQIKTATEMVLVPTKNTANLKSKTDLINSAVSASVTRHGLMANLLSKDPKAFLQLAIPQKVASNLPKEVQDNLEKEVSYTGQIENLFLDNFDKKTSVTEFYLNHNGRRERLYFSDAGPIGVSTGSTVSVNGYEFDGKVVVASSQDSPINTAYSLIKASSVSTSVIKKVAVVLFNFQDNQAKPWTADSVKEVTFTSPDSVNTYYKTVSNNKLAITGDVFDWVTVPVSQNGCNYYDGSEAAKGILSARGVNLDSYDNVIYAFPGMSCWFGGLAEIGGKRSWINGSYELNYGGPVKRSGLVVHEFGHNLGLLHANSYTCTNSTGQRVSIDSPLNCQSQEYGDPFDVMGWDVSGSRNFNNIHEDQLGWLPAGNIKLANTSGDYTLLPIEQNNAAGIQLLKIPAGQDQYSNKLFYYLEYRRPVGLFDNFSATDPVVNGVTIRLMGNSWGNVTSNLIDTVVSNGDYNYNDSPLMGGKIFIDVLRGVKIKVLQTADKFVKISLSKTPPPCVHSVPKIDLYPIAGWGTPGESLYYGMSITNLDTLGCGSSKFDVNPTLFSGWTQSTANGTTLPVAIAPYQTTYIGLYVESNSFTPAGYYSFTEKVTSTAGNNYSGSISANYNVYYSDTTPPTVKFIIPHNGDTLSGSGNIQIEASDNTQISYVVLFDNDQYLCGWSVGPFNCYYDSTKLNYGNNTLRAEAYDILYNGSTATISVNYQNPTSSPSPTGTPIVSTPTPSGSPHPSSPPTPTATPKATPTASPTISPSAKPSPPISPTPSPK